MEELRERQHKLQVIAEHHGIEVDRHEENREQAQKLEKDLAILEKQKRIAVAAMETMTKKYEAAIQEKRREYEGLWTKKAMILKGYQEKMRVLRDKGLEIQELIERAKTGADRGLVEILSKWEEANAKIMDKYEDEGDVERKLLEQAAIEVKKGHSPEK